MPFTMLLHIRLWYHLHLKSQLPLHTYLHFPDSSDIEAYDDAHPPLPGTTNKLTTYSDACWGSQIGNAVKAGTLLPLFKFRSMSGCISFRMGGPITWKAIRQDKTSQSSCEAEIRATNEGGKSTMGIRLTLADLRRHGYPVSDDFEATDVFNDNEACVQWSHIVTSKNIRHMELKENSIREWVQDKSLTIKFVKGKDNPADIFTKEMRDGAHFRRLRDSFMSRLHSFTMASNLATYRDSHRSSSTINASACSANTTTHPVSCCACTDLLDTLLTTVCRTTSLISQLSSSGHPTLSRPLASV